MLLDKLPQCFILKSKYDIDTFLDYAIHSQVIFKFILFLQG